MEGFPPLCDGQSARPRKTPLSHHTRAKRTCLTPQKHEACKLAVGNGAASVAVINVFVIQTSNVDLSSWFSSLAVIQSCDAHSPNICLQCGFAH